MLIIEIAVLAGLTLTLYSIGRSLRRFWPDLAWRDRLLDGAVFAFLCWQLGRAVWTWVAGA